jgi:O-antigen/teichoic acid export membrane protein
VHQESPAAASSAPTEPNPKRYGKVAKRGVVWSFTRESVTELITLPAAFILARQLSPFDFGVAASAAFFLTLARRLTNFGFNLALTRLKELRPEHSSSVFVTSIGIGVTAFLLLTAGGPVMASFFRAPQLVEIMPCAIGSRVLPARSSRCRCQSPDLVIGASFGTRSLAMPSAPPHAW